MKLAEYQNEDAIDLLADLLDPVTEIIADPEVKRLWYVGNKIKLIQHALKSHKKQVLEIMARLDDVPVEEYKCNVFTLPIKILQLLNDEELISFFDSQGLKIGNGYFGSVTENTEAVEEK